MAAFAMASIQPMSAQENKEPVDMGKIMRTYFAPRVLSPEVHADQTVTFRYLAPNAQSVELNCQFLKKNLPMTKDENGVWSVTTGKVKPDIYPYEFIVDGTRVADPNNVDIFPNENFKGSLLDVKGKKPSAQDLQDVPHGKVTYAFYHSNQLDLERPLLIYTPAEYADNPEKDYPVLYLIHGMTDTHETWYKVGRMNYILDNLIAQGKAVPMIVVMPYGNVFGSTPSPTTLAAAKMYQKFEQELTECVMPFVEKNFRTKNNRESRAIAGFSRGGGQSLYSVYSNFDKFAYLASYSAYLTPEVMDTYFPDLQSKMSQLKLMWFGVGTSDFLYQNVLDHQKYFDEKGISYETMFTEGGHTWMNCRDYIELFAKEIFK